MKISSKTRYAVSAMIDLALKQNSGALTIADISRQQSISLSYLEQIFAELRRAGLVKGTRGPGGGYRLALPAEAVTLGEIVRALGEQGKPYTEENGYEPFSVWSTLSEKIMSYVDTISLKQCIDDAANANSITSNESLQASTAAVAEEVSA